MISKMVIKNYKIFSNNSKPIYFNAHTNIFVGNNDSGKSTILEAISIVTTGKLNRYSFDRQIKANLFNSETRESYIKDVKRGVSAKLPKIIIEAYCDTGSSDYKGTNNTLGEDCVGINVTVEFNKDHSDTYKELLNSEKIYDIPVEFYKTSINYFSSRAVSFRYSPFNISYIDTTKKDYMSMIDRFVSDNISNYLSDKDIIDLNIEYRKNKNAFSTNEIVKRLNTALVKDTSIADKEVKIEMKEEAIDEWKKDMSISIDNIPFEHVGFGSQNTIKIELALNDENEEVNIIIMEEPENNLSFSNMSKLISKLQKNKNKQLFISTHSSFVANKLGLNNIILVSKGKTESLNKLNEVTMNYFKKLPGYNTLRLVLSDSAILVEGPADDLIVQRAFLDKYGELPIEKGIDVIVVGSLAFKRYCDIALLINKTVKIVTDNDGDVEKNIIEKYEDYLKSDLIEICYEKNRELHTLEYSVAEANKDDLSDFKSVILKKGVSTFNKEQVIEFMSNNKTEWALRVFDSQANINYPGYIEDAIK